MTDMNTYEEQVYAGLLGKTIGVYMGRPFEQWHRPQIAEKWGMVDRYVHEDQGVPLVVSDDDISGTLTFIRVLEDTDLFADTPDEAFGQAWLNYIMERRTILWWGGYGMSTEHTAYINLKNGIKSPRSGSIEINGKPVAEQIGAQIFIDAFGMVAPGDPDLAVKLARKSARVSHDGEAVHAACVVAAMVSMAFVEKDMFRLLDAGVQMIPASSETAQVHRDVRSWSENDKDWEKTYGRIYEKYGYQHYGGTCHVIPNHALMVMAWSYAPDSFYKSQCIINSAGWDTDCNAANVGSVMGVKVGLERINEDYAFQQPFGDRLIIPTAEGTRSVSDVLNESLSVSAIGRRLMGLPKRTSPKKGAFHHFEMPGAQHGFLVDELDSGSRNTTILKNIEGHSVAGRRSLCISFDGLNTDRVSRTSTPILPSGPGALYGSAQQMQATPRLYPGNEVIIRGTVSENLTGVASVRVYLRQYAGETCFYSDTEKMEPSARVALRFTIPGGAWPIQDIGLEIQGENASGAFYLDGLWIEGLPRFKFPDRPLMGPGDVPVGWISNVEQTMVRPFPADKQEMMRICQNEGPALLVTGNKDWVDYTFETQINVHLARQAGIVARYQGLQRYIALVKTGNEIRLIERYYGDRVIDTHPVAWEPDEDHILSISCVGEAITAACDGEEMMRSKTEKLLSGGAGYFVENGLVGFHSTTIN